jgi:hypothetical protein
MKLIKLRNPWGKGEWTGKWSKSHSYWTPELKRKLNHSSIKKGVFFIPLTAMIKYFHCFQICYFHDNYKYSSKMVTDVKKSPALFFDIRVNSKGVFYISLNQINKRSYIFDPNYDYSTMILILYKFGDNNKPEYIAANMKNRKENWIKTILTPGRYILEVRQYIKTFIDSFVLSVYGPSNCKIERKSFGQLGRKNINSILVEAIQDFGVRNPDNKPKAISSKNMNYSLVDLRNGIGYVIFQNNEMDYHLNVTANLSNSKNINVIYPGKEMQITLEVPGFQKKLIIFLSEGLPYSVSVSLSFITKRDSQRNQRIGVYKKRSNVPKQPKKIIQPPKPIDNKEFENSLKKSYFNRQISKNKDDICYVYESLIDFPIIIKSMFVLDNCYIENYFKAEFNFILLPKQFHFLSIKPIDSNQKFNAELISEKVENLI